MAQNMPVLSSKVILAAPLTPNVIDASAVGAGHLSSCECWVRDAQHRVRCSLSRQLRGAEFMAFDRAVVQRLRTILLMGVPMKRIPVKIRDTGKDTEIFLLDCSRLMTFSSSPLSKTETDSRFQNRKPMTSWPRQEWGRLGKLENCRATSSPTAMP